ncbi:hypothetical protein ACF06X_14705 [Streptomyces sp. NPDC015346]|uniref:hypothetical protein n=1 Tax=Streptomyces sp. NPDC015346 TaxID=3364954 RepID=UPI0036F95758
MSYDFDELGRVGSVLNEALTLLENEQKRLEQQYRGQATGAAQSAGSPAQTLHGISDLVNGVRERIESIALCVGYASLGLMGPADRGAGAPPAVLCALGGRPYGAPAR